MPKVIGVRFRTSPRIYYFAPTEGENYEKNMQVVVETQRGVELATVILPPHDVTDDQIVAPLKPVARIATESDLDAARADIDQKHDILITAKEKVAARGLDMKIVDCEFTVDHSKLVLYFTAENRVDFRELVRDLASAFHMRIDLRQIGPRDECKLIGSLGACGMPCCCGRFESDAAHVSIKMAKNQNLALTPNKINGMCGRLLCCLAYENKTYEDIMRRMPKHGAWVTCPDGRKGSVVSVTPLTEKVRVRIGDDESFEFAEFSLEELSFEGKIERAVSENASDANRSEKNNKGGKAENGERPQQGKNKKNGGRFKKGKQDDRNDKSGKPKNGGKSDKKNGDDRGGSQNGGGDNNNNSNNGKPDNRPNGGKNKNRNRRNKDKRNNNGNNNGGNGQKQNNKPSDGTSGGNTENK